MEAEAPTRDHEYLRGLGNAVCQGVEYAIQVVGLGEERAPPVPVALITQARLAARQRIPLDMVMRRYVAAMSLLDDYLLEEASHAGVVDPALLKSAAAAHASAFEQVLASATDEYKREESAHTTSSEERRVKLVQRLLAGERVDPSPLEYDLDGHHLGLVALSADARPLLRQLAEETGGRVLPIVPSEGEVSAWIGSRDPINIEAASRWLDADWPESIPLGIGEPTQSRNGWRLTHEQARGAAFIARSSSNTVSWYRDVILLECASRDPLLRASLQEMYLSPLAEKGGRGEIWRRTLRTYFDSGCNSRAAADILGISRQTVTNHLDRVETILDRPIANCADSLRAALCLEELASTSA
jgi:hypothetical protein